MKNIFKCIFALSGLMVSFSSTQLPSSTNGFHPPSFYFYNPATLPTFNSATVANPTSKHDITYHDYPTSTLLGSHVVFLTTCLKDLKDSNQKLAQTSKLLDETNTVVENVKKELAELKNTPNSSTESLKIELNDTKKRLTEATTVIEILKNDVNGNTQRLEDMAKQFSIVKQEFNSTKLKIGDLTSELTKSTAPSSIGKIPASCGDLLLIGHKKSGLFSIMESNKVVTVYCDFTKLSNDSASQKWIGYADVKSLPTFFYAQKTSPFSTLHVPIPFENIKLNIGGAMDIKAGKFTAPRKGVYFFSFSGVGKMFSTGGHVDVTLMVNSNPVGYGECMSLTGREEWQTYSIQSTVDLKAGDQVWVKISSLNSAVLHDEAKQFTHFTGWMLQEDLSP